MGRYILCAAHAGFCQRGPGLDPKTQNSGPVLDGKTNGGSGHCGEVSRKRRGGADTVSYSYTGFGVQADMVWLSGAEWGITAAVANQEGGVVPAPLKINRTLARGGEKL
ncbi:hypothetical protein DPEC_G00010710 [Dallia pectoralis]|uniref:Uncharacterized protein n=1 Tax=Dallia pectoralis TaxID=75939 RepID=A0ACC2HM44_DALPE|nr:hypothetical protein DPEC_G00010710 [Dallia pectoralis]